MTRRGAGLRLLALVGVIGVGVLLAVIIGVPTATQLRADARRLGAWAPLLFAAFYALATLSPLPKSVFTLAAGAVFGLTEGLLVVLTGAISGALLAFYLARALGRDGVQRLIGRRAAQFHQHVARQEFRTVLLARLIPIVPFTVVNYLAGLTTIRVRVFVAATVIGILPTTTAYVALGAYGSRPGSWPFWVAVLSLVALSVGGGVSHCWRRRRSTRAGGADGQNGWTAPPVSSATSSTSAEFWVGTELGANPVTSPREPRQHRSHRDR